MSTDLFQTLFSNVWSIFLVALFFGGSIFIHELGHFLAARGRGVHVERFSIGFGPPIFSWRGKDGVEYRLSWIPLGGYVLLPQLADLGPIEGKSEVDIEALPPISYSTRMIVFVAGAVFNVLFAFALACVVWLAGQPTFSVLATTKLGTVSATVTLPDGKVVPSPAADAGLKPGDDIKAIDGRPVANFEDIINAVLFGHGRTSDGRRESTFAIERDGRRFDVVVHPLLLGDDQIRACGVEPAEDLTAEAVLPGTPAEKAGVQPGDRIVAIDGMPVFQRSAVSEHLARNPDRPTEFLLQRGASQVTLRIQPRFEKDERSGKPYARVGLRYKESILVLHPTPWTQISEDVQTTFRTISALLSPTSDIGPSKLSGPIGIARALHQQAQWDIRRVLWFTILVNVNLAIFNLMPIPVLDGGQMLFATIGRLRRRALPTSFILATQSAFFVLIFSLIIYVSFFDVRRIVRDVQNERAEATSAAKP